MRRRRMRIGKRGEEGKKEGREEGRKGGKGSASTFSIIQNKFRVGP